eukprot:TRINITY_DN3337_c0_g1_i1.p1 TRINITY_DN3337_c0_g1~~TRINITY_DN3337_c0_g1_i1.p1  ORF type:complete len:234 (-),score=52.78 TRINITY_DN3337_c0_g1_i1:18-719(-)
MSAQNGQGGEDGDITEYVFKVMVVGAGETGKTALIQRIVRDVFSSSYRVTIGVDFAMKTIRWDDKTIIRLQLWDIAGQERFGRMTRVYYKEAVGAFVVFDCTKEATFDLVSFWKDDIEAKVTLPDGSRLPTVLLANKCDLAKEGKDMKTMGTTDLDEYCRAHNFDGWKPTSAKDATNVDEAVNLLVGIIRKSVVEYQNKFFNGKVPSEDIIKLGQDDLDNDTDDNGGQRRCCG